ncbi:hypothetical protein Pmani_009596 [Petrolisthes manimaculis]|uniref:Alpha 1,4-glycosyltransferase domain-containing protein n=2 Tax=Petrolisthes manimaculis TaxID=1843537 RepID=A0AAE1UI90_9EUCA|nr:hypothetical protein Pmani_009591 [Petrolisthes manimaculis]KAK4319494.1 hypothetical protein Pmani_009596 [Petrolisthes manimaculis]
MMTGVVLILFCIVYLHPRIVDNNIPLPLQSPSSRSYLLSSILQSPPSPRDQILSSLHSTQPDTVVASKWWKKFLCKSLPDNTTNSQFTLPLLFRDTQPTRTDYNVFLLDTACNTHPKYRAWCSVESWARQNPNLDVWYLLTSPTADNTDHLLTHLLHHYPNLNLATLDLDKIFHDLPVNKLFNSRRWTRVDTWPVEVLSNMLRASVLWHWGGVYSDTDVISIKPFTIPVNAVGLENKGVVASAFLSFTKNNPVLWALMKDMNTHFEPNKWGCIGPQAVTRVIRSVCKNDTTKLDIPKDGKPQTCNNITIYPSQFFSPIYYKNFKAYISGGGGKNFEKDFSNTFLMHFWNKITKNVVVKAGSGSIYDVAAKKSCPVTYQMATLRANHF